MDQFISQLVSNPVFWIVGIIVVLSPVLNLWLRNPKRKGQQGERRVADRLRRGLPSEYKLLNDVYLPLPDGTTTQIDHIVVSQYGIFVVETKSYSGWIFGSEWDSEWTQSFPSKKITFQNPKRQNNEHICALVYNLGIDKSCFIGVVALTGNCTFKTDMPEGVVYSRNAADYIRSFGQPRIMPEQVGKIASMIAERQGTLSKEQIKNHVSNLKKRHSGF